MLSLEELAAQLDLLLQDLDQSQAEHEAAIAAVAGEHRAGAMNLVHYTALRQRDIRELQHDLLDIGATSLATTEPDVRAKVQAARNVVGALAREPGPWGIDANNAALDRGGAILESNVEAALGPLRPEGATRIMVTLPSEAATDLSLVAECVAAGMDIARIIGAHDDTATWEAMAANVRAAAESAGRTVLVSMDMPAPNCARGRPSLARP